LSGQKQCKISILQIVHTPKSTSSSHFQQKAYPEQTLMFNNSAWISLSNQRFIIYFSESFRSIQHTVSTWHDTFWLMSGFVPVRGNISCQNGNMSTPSETAHSWLQTDVICGKFDIHITVLTIEVYGNKSA